MLNQGNSITNRSNKDHRNKVIETRPDRDLKYYAILLFDSMFLKEKPAVMILGAWGNLRKILTPSALSQKSH